MKTEWKIWKLIKLIYEFNYASRKFWLKIKVLLETGFKGREVILVENMLKELNAIECDTDEMQIKLRKQLRNIENELNPIDVMFLYKIIDWVGGLADIAERVGSRLELMLAS